MGEKENKPFQLSFNGLLKVDFQGSRVTSDGGLILVRELDERLGLGKLIDEHLTDSRQGSNKNDPAINEVIVKAGEMVDEVAAERIERDEEANTQWVKNKASPFNCLSTGL